MLFGGVVYFDNFIKTAWFGQDIKFLWSRGCGYKNKVFIGELINIKTKRVNAGTLRPFVLLFAAEFFNVVDTKCTGNIFLQHFEDLFEFLISIIVQQLEGVNEVTGVTIDFQFGENCIGE